MSLIFLLLCLGACTQVVDADGVRFVEQGLTGRVATLYPVGNAGALSQDWKQASNRTAGTCVPTNIQAQSWQCMNDLARPPAFNFDTAFNDYLFLGSSPGDDSNACPEIFGPDCYTMFRMTDLQDSIGTTRYNQITSITNVVVWATTSWNGTIKHIDPVYNAMSVGVGKAAATPATAAIFNWVTTINPRTRQPWQKTDLIGFNNYWGIENAERIHSPFYGSAFASDFTIVVNYVTNP